MRLFKDIEELHMCFMLAPSCCYPFLFSACSPAENNYHGIIWWASFIPWAWSWSLTLYPKQHNKAPLPNKLLIMNGRTISSPEFLTMFKIVPTPWGCEEVAMYSRVPGTLVSPQLLFMIIITVGLFKWGAPLCCWWLGGSTSFEIWTDLWRGNMKQRFSMTAESRKELLSQHCPIGHFVIVDTFYKP